MKIYILREVRVLFFCFVGMHFSQSVAIIQSQVGVIKGVQVLYSDTVSTDNSIRTYSNNKQFS